jgi:hypothetical protein
LRYFRLQQNILLPFDNKKLPQPIDIVGGPVIPVFPDGCPEHLRTLFSKT